MRGEDAAELLPLLRDQAGAARASADAAALRRTSRCARASTSRWWSDTIVAKVTFERQGDGRRFSLTNGGWFEGTPG
ncbi:MAG: hypothetical protein QM756_29950 [Polyangiaceae bacterium]